MGGVWDEIEVWGVNGRWRIFKLDWISHPGREGKQRRPKDQPQGGGSVHYLVIGEEESTKESEKE